VDGKRLGAVHPRRTRYIRFTCATGPKRPTPLGQNVLASWPTLRQAMMDLNPNAGLTKALDAYRIYVP